MKQRFFIVALLLSMLAVSNSIFAGNDGIVKAPDISILIDGQIDNYTNPPLVINGRTMLPLRELLTNLGVPNDDEHIIWNGQDQTVTVKHEDQTILLTIDSDQAMVNGQKIILDCAPIVYHQYNRTYIPVRFVSEALGKSVDWINSARSVLISDKAKYEKAYQLYENSQVNHHSKNLAGEKVTVRFEQFEEKPDQTKGRHFYTEEVTQADTNHRVKIVEEWYDNVYDSDPEMPNVHSFTESYRDESYDYEQRDQEWSKYNASSWEVNEEIYFPGEMMLLSHLCQLTQLPDGNYKLALDVDKFKIGAPLMERWVTPKPDYIGERSQEQPEHYYEELIINKDNSKRISYRYENRLYGKNYSNQEMTEVNLFSVNYEALPADFTVTIPQEALNAPLR